MPRSMPVSAVDTVHRACLVAKGGVEVPLLGVELTGEVFGAQARMVLRQRYKCLEKKAIEAIYTFPVPSEAVLVGFTMECGGRRLEAEVKPREEAFAAYDEAISAGHGAALLDEERRNIFTASVGNLLPGEETIIEVVYLQSLRADEGALRLVVPTVVAPRYVPPGTPVDRTGHGSLDPNSRVSDADRISPEFGAVSSGLSLDVVFDLGRAVSIESPSHSIAIEDLGGTKQRVKFRGSDARLDRDLVLVASGTDGIVAGVTAERRSGQKGTFALTVVPDLFDPSERAAARDVVFVVDTSGSMQGASIDEARAALRLCLRQLAEGDRFEIIAFSSQMRAMHGSLLPFNQATLERADDFVSRLEAAGGTEMLAPLLAALGTLGDKKRDRIIVMLTDGQVGNEAEIVRSVADAADGARVYTFGIGTAVSDLLVNDLARRTRGAAEMIYPGERIDDKVTAQFARAIAARVSSVTLAFEGAIVDELAPADLPDLVDGEPWVVSGRFTEAASGRAKIRGTSSTGAFYLEVPLELPAEATREGLTQLWARARIRDLEEAKLDGRRAVANEKRITDISVEYKVASKYASFVVVEKRSGDRLVTGQPEARPVPVNAPAGFRQRHAPPVPQAPHFYAQHLAAPMASFGGPPGMGAPPPPAAMSPMDRRAPSPPASMGAPRSRGLIADTFERAKRVLFHDAEVASDDEVTGSFSRDERSAGKGTGASTDDGSLGALFARQLASGLWNGDGDDDAALLMSTARVLARAFGEGVDAAHPMFGAQIKKAVEAILARAAALGSDAKTERARVAAVLAAYLVSTGKRQKDQLRVLARDGAFAAIEPTLAGPREAASAKLAELTA